MQMKKRQLLKGLLNGIIVFDIHDPSIMKNASNFCFLVQSSMFSFAILIFNLAGLLNFQISDWFIYRPQVISERPCFFPYSEIGSHVKCQALNSFLRDAKISAKNLAKIYSND